MADIIDYALLNAHKDFDVLPYSEIDGLVLSQLAYLNYNGIVPTVEDDKDGVLLSQVAQAEDYEAVFPLERTAERNKKLLNAVAYSNRYGKIKVNYREDIFDSEKEIQFYAVTFIMPDGNACIAFRGTDATITGWKENFNMLFMSPVSSQKYAVKYVDTVAKKIDGKIYLMGHSKGGNLAVYAGTKCHNLAKSKFAAIQSYDSPGFTQEFIESEKYIQAEKIIFKFIPEESMVGVILNDSSKCRIIKSAGSGVMQHDPFLWQIDIENNDFIDGEKLLLSSQFFDATFNNWVNNATPKQREQFIDALFRMVDAANSENVKSFTELSENIKNNASAFYENLKELDPETRNLILKGFGKLFSTVNKNLKSAPKYFWEDTAKKLKELGQKSPKDNN